MNPPPPANSLDLRPPAAKPSSTLFRYAGIYFALVKNSVAREMGFKSNFLLWIVVDLLWFALAKGMPRG